VVVIRDLATTVLPQSRFPVSGISAKSRRDYIAQTTLLLLAERTRIVVDPTTVACRYSKNDQRNHAFVARSNKARAETRFRCDFRA
jgi:hypothetical protein